MAWTALESLSTTIAGNTPDGTTEDADTISAYLRAAAGLLRQSLTAGSDIASASTITPASTGSTFGLTGTTTVTAIGSTNSWNGRVVGFHHKGAHQFTDSASLICVGGENITFASGDYSEWRQESSGTWRQVKYIRGDGKTTDRGIQSSGITSGALTIAAAGKTSFLTGNATITDDLFSAGDVIVLVNHSASSITLTEDTNLTMYFAGTTSEGNRTLAARGRCVIEFQATNTAYISGAGLS